MLENLDDSDNSDIESESYLNQYCSNWNKEVIWVYSNSNPSFIVGIENNTDKNNVRKLITTIGLL